MTANDLLDLYRRMVRIRRFEERVARLYAEGQIPGMVHLCIGQEATAVGVCAVLRPGDWISTTHRGHGHHIARGARLGPMFAELLGREGGVCHGRSGCLHLTDMSVGSLGAFGIVGASCIVAPGAALSAVLRGEDSVAVAFFGEGATGQGMFHEAVNLAAAWKLPVVFVCENNLYSEATPYAQVAPPVPVAERAAAYGIPGRQVDGNDVLAVRQAAAEAVARARAGEGPSLLECLTYRWRGHYEGDPETYRSPDEVEEWRNRCPIARLRAHLLEQGVEAGVLDEIEVQVASEVEAAVEEAQGSPFPGPETLDRDLFAPAYQPPPDLVLPPSHAATGSPPPAARPTRLLNGVAAIQEALREEMRRDERVFLMGEDLRQAVFGVTTPLFDEFGPERVRNTPISESAIVGCALGAAMTGMRPVVEIMFEDFLLVCADAILNQVAKQRYMTGGQATIPLVIRVPGGCGLSAGGQHSQSLEATFIHYPGLKVACPSTPTDMKGLLKRAIRDPNPVLFFEHKALYYEGGEVPEGEYLIPFGVADVKRVGTDVTVVAILGSVPVALRAAEDLAAEGVSVEVVDPRTLVPLDEETILASVRKTHRLVVVEEGPLTGGIGAEIAARVAERAVEYLDAPIVRVAAPDVVIPFTPALESLVPPDEGRIAAAVRRVLGR